MNLTYFKKLLFKFFNKNREKKIYYHITYNFNIKFIIYCLINHFIY